MRSVLCASILLLLCLLPARGTAQDLEALADTILVETTRGRGFVRAAETQYSKVRAAVERLRELLNDSTTPSEPLDSLLPPTVVPWTSGEWELNVSGHHVSLDLDREQARAYGVVAPVVGIVNGDTLEVRLDIPGYFDAGAVRVVHTEGRLIGVLEADSILSPVAGQRADLRVVQTQEVDGCTLAQYTDGSWGISPNVATCHQALDRIAGPLKFVARIYEP